MRGREQKAHLAIHRSPKRRVTIDRCVRNDIDEKSTLRYNSAKAGIDENPSSLYLSLAIHSGYNYVEFEGKSQDNTAEINYGLDKELFQIK